MNGSYYGYNEPELDPAEVSRLLDLLPAGLRDSVEILPAPDRQTTVIKGQRQFLWRRRLRLFVKPHEWRQFTPNQRSGLFLHKVGYYSRAISRQIDFYLALTALGSLSLVFEAFQQDPVGITVSGGLGGLALWQLRRDQTNDRRLLAADAYAVDRLVLRGIPRLQAVEALGQALHVEARLEGRSGNELLDVLRYQNLKRLAQRPAEDIVLS
ncbi:MAG: DUF3318 domain-containing protein [Cyanobacteriota bacterium]|nr:DUF3318 domain-containing protein [Cyanobacteriota bacterium]